MLAERALRLATFATVAAGIGALWTGGLIGLSGLLLTALGMIVAGGLRRWVVSTLAFDRALGVAVAGFALLDVLYLAERIFDGLVRLLVLLVLLRLATARRARDFRDAGLLAFFMLVASAAVAFSFGFVLALVAFLTTGTALLVLAHELGEAERLGGGRVGPGRAVGRSLLVLSLGATAASLAVTMALFFVIPRLGEATLGLRSQARRMVIGFSDRVEIGDIGELEADSSVAMRVRLQDPPRPELLGELRWRGVALDHFDGRAWSVSPGRKVTVFRGSGGIDVGSRAGRLLSQEVFLEPFGTDTLFAAPRAVHVSRRSGLVLVDDMGAILLPAPASQLRYTVQSLVGAGYVERLEGAARRRYLQLPPLAPRIHALARQVASGAAPAAAAPALVNYLRREFTYSLVLERMTSLDPLEEFLFVRRSGNCEYFASALAVMLRSLGIPARVATGFQRGTWNPYGEYFLVRMADAHAWVEAYIEEGSSWVTLDPSPRTEVIAAGPWSGAGLYLDALRLTWQRYIVNWTRQDQIRAASSLRRVATGWRLEGGAFGGWGYARWGLTGLVLAGLALAWVRSRRAQAGGRARPAPVPDFYRRALRILDRRGLRPDPSETAREFAVRVGATQSAWLESMAGITTTYESVRFGEVLLHPALTADVRGWLRNLDRP